MTAQPHGRGCLPAGGIQQLLGHQDQIREAVVGKLPETLLQTTVQAVMDLDGKQVAGRALSPRVLELVRHSLQGLAQQKWKPDTILLLQKHRRGERSEGHGASE